MDPNSHDVGALLGILTGHIVQLEVNTDSTVEIGQDEIKQFETTWPEGLYRRFPNQMITLISHSLSTLYVTYRWQHGCDDQQVNVLEKPCCGVALNQWGSAKAVIMFVTAALWTIDRSANSSVQIFVECSQRMWVLKTETNATSATKL
jgi:hypothetical protein